MSWKNIIKADSKEEMFREQGKNIFGINTTFYEGFSQ